MAMPNGTALWGTKLTYFPVLYVSSILSLTQATKKSADAMSIQIGLIKSGS